MATAPRLDLFEVAELGSRLRDNISRAVKAPDQVVRDLIVALLAEGHVLIEDAPGVGKTALARALARSLEAEYARVQCTSDLLPADLVGTKFFNQRTSTFEFHPGPVFAKVVMVDEINRASPKTQSGLLECMQERQITIDGHKHELALPFVVLATQNPAEYEGTYPLPEAELDRFTMRIAIGYPPLPDEAQMLSEQATDTPIDRLECVASAQEVLDGIEDAKRVFVEESLNRYIVALLRQTRSDNRLYLGASPRAGIALLRVAKARALVSGRDYVEPDDIKAVAPTVLAHRLILAPEARSSGLDAEDLVRSILERTPVPV
jgi:MoxR-like ATPase